MYTRRRLSQLGIAATVLLAGMLPAGAGTLYVSPSGLDIAPYTNWATASSSIQAAIDEASAGDTVLVDEGTYYEMINFVGKAITVESRYLVEDDPAYIYSTVINASNMGRVVTFDSGETTNSILRGFMITGGQTSGSTPEEKTGGGIQCWSSSATLEDLIVEYNHAAGEGGGIYLVHSYAVLRDLVIFGNTADASGAGVRISYGLPVLENLDIRANVGSAGGGMHIYHSAPTLRNCLIVSNQCTTKGGALHFDDGDALIENCTIVGNHGGQGDGLNVSYQSHVTIKNSILWGNEGSDQVFFDTQWSGEQLTVLHSNIRGGRSGIVSNNKGSVYWQAGNLDTEPLFAPTVNFRLTASSPCVNAGTNEAWMAGGTDLAGNPRIHEGLVDMGVYEFTGTTGPWIGTPSKPVGASTKLVNAWQVYTCGVVEGSDCSVFQYRFSWGDGFTSPWLSSNLCGHSWSSSGVYAVRAQARCASSNGLVSAWSEALDVTVEPQPMPAATRYVSKTGSNLSPYTNWATAARSIQDAIDVAVDGDHVIVAEGTYHESIDFCGKAITVESLYDVYDDASYIDATVISGGSTARVVRFHGGENDDSVLRGFTIADGATSGSTPEEKTGAGIQCWYSSPTLEDLVVEGNYAAGEGGGIYLLYSYARLRNLVIQDNTTDLSGGAIRISYGNPTIENTEMRGNFAQAGGAMLIYHSPTLMRNCLIVSNRCTTKGGALHFDDGDVTLENCTIMNNVGGDGDGLNVSYQSHVTIKNSILWGNPADQIFFDTQWWGEAVTVSHSTIQGGRSGIVSNNKGAVYWEAGNLEDAPLIAADDSYYLTGSSPCRNSGANEGWMTDGIDLAGNPRIMESIVDMGAYEFEDGAAMYVGPPDVPQGPSMGRVDETYFYMAHGATSQPYSVYQYRLDWGDGTVSGWVSSNYAAHAWSESGSFPVRAQARCVTNLDAVSTWSPALYVTITQGVPPVVMTHYVSEDGSDTPPYADWTSAAHSIQDAIDIAVEGATVIVDEGTYYEHIDFGGKDIVVESLYRMSNDYWFVEYTVIDGGGNGRVVNFENGETAAAVLRGFTIRNGSTPEGEAAVEQGGGIRCVYADPRLENLIVEENAASGEGGGIYMAHSDVELYDVVVRNNTSGASGGGIRVSYGLPSMDRLIIQQNVSPQVAGGLHLYHSSPTIRNTLVVGNHAGARGGGIFLDDSDPLLENVTLVDNSADIDAGGLSVSYSSHPVLRNGIAWGNSPGQIAYDPTWYGMGLTVEYSDIQGGLAGIDTHGKGAVTWGAGNLNSDPQFISSSEYLLSAGSPCVDAGADQDWMQDGEDLAGNDRIRYTHVDMGAYEVQEAYSNVVVSAPGLMMMHPRALRIGEEGFFIACCAHASDAGAVEYRVNWGDGTESTWSPSTNRYHMWNAPGVYSLAAQARSAAQPSALSPWSDEILVTVTQGVQQSTIHYVSESGSNIPPYESWVSAAWSIQDAIDVAADGDLVLVAEGVHKGQISFRGKSITVESLYRETGDRATIENTIIDGGGTNRVVLFNNGEDADAVLRGFTIRNGYTPPGVPEIKSGGGIQCWSADPTLEHLVVEDNFATGEGGGIYMVHSEPTLYDVVVRDNESQASGAGIRVSYGLPSMDRLRIEGNVSAFGGGGMLLYHSSPVIRNALIVSNSAVTKGGGIHFDGSNPRLENVTMTGNTGGDGGALNISYCSHPQLVNTIVWNNGAEGIVYDTDWWGMGLTVNFSDIEGGLAGIQTRGKGSVTWGAGNIDTDPLFTAPGQYDLQAGSPCVDTGSNMVWMTGSVDLAGEDRIQDDVVDMGAYERGDAPSPLGSITCDIYPAQVRELGAAWTLDGMTGIAWQASGAVLRNVPAGAYTVAFKSIDSWTTPSSIMTSVGTGTLTEVAGEYTQVLPDTIPPTIVSVYPPDGYVGFSNHVYMLITVTDNVGVATVKVNKRFADALDETTWEHTTIGVRGSHNPQVIVATDEVGNQSTQIVIYGKSNKLKLRSLWDGYWRVANPYASNVTYTWTVDGSSESDTRVAASNRYDYFNTSLGPKVVRIWVNGEQVDVCGWSPHAPPEQAADDLSNLDSDVDGVSNFDEEVAGTDMNNAGSLFRVSVEAADDGDGGGGVKTETDASPTARGILFSWESGSDSAYTLQVSTNLAVWATIPDYNGIPGTGDTMTYTNDTPGNIFYLRIKAEKLP